MSKRKTPEEFLAQVSTVNPNIHVLGLYVDAVTKIRFECKECGHIWETKPSTVLCGRGCPECGKKKIGQSLRKTHEQFIEELKTKNPNKSGDALYVVGQRMIIREAEVVRLIDILKKLGNGLLSVADKQYIYG